MDRAHVRDGDKPPHRDLSNAAARFVVDPDGYTWMVGTHKTEPTAKEMKKGMEEMMKQQPAVRQRPTENERPQFD
jgi:hypothetical protein